LPIPNIIWMIFLFALGASIGSFINVIVYRTPRDLSIVKPGSHCTSCNHPIRFYDNIPILSWFILRGLCRHCHAKFSIRYALVELFTGLLFVFLFYTYFIQGVRQGMPALNNGGWMVYSGHIILLVVLLISSLIDAENWFIPMSVVYFGVVIALIFSAFAPYLIEPAADQFNQLTPLATPKTAAMALGSLLGLIIAIILLETGILKPSDDEIEEHNNKSENANDKTSSENELEEMFPEIPAPIIRRNMFREIMFLTPPIAGGLIFCAILAGEGGLSQWWQDFLTSQKWALGLLGSIFGFMIGGAVVWATRILGSLAFGKEAMGLGDVHLMAGVGAMLASAGKSAIAADVAKQKSAGSGLVPTRPFGKSKINVSILSLGGMFDIPGNQLLLKQALKWGVNYWDTADCYGWGRSEKGIGKYFKKYPQDRKKVFLVTKSDDRA